MICPPLLFRRSLLGMEALARAPGLFLVSCFPCGWTQAREFGCAYHRAEIPLKL